MRREADVKGIRRVAPLVVVACLGMAVVATIPTPAAADVTAISPSFREVDPGGTTSATVTVEWPGQTCVSAQPSSAALQPTFSRVCSDEPKWTTTLTVQVPADPGTYSVTVGDDRSNVSKTFTVRVRTPAPASTTTTPATTTTTVATTTTKPTTATTADGATTTTVASTSTTAAAPTTTVAETTTTTAALAGDPFEPLAALVERPVPDEGVFLPLVGNGYRNCLPLTKACGDPGSGLVLIPARSTELTWQPLGDGAVSAPRTDLRGIAPIPAVGVGPSEPRSHNYALSVLDLTAPGGQLRTLLRGMDERGDLGVVAVEQPTLRAAVGGPAVDVGSATSIASMPFGRPAIRTASSFTEAAPAIAMFASVEPQVLYAIRPDNAWGLNLDLVPLLGDSVPFLVRAIEGPPGLFIARPPNLRVPDAGAAADVADDAADDSGGGGTSPIALLGIAVVAAAFVTVAIGLIRRRRAVVPEPPKPAPKPKPAPPRTPPNRPRGTSR
jgi:hypothetical protein